ncbi:MAG: DUF1566 domain-containing protein [Acidobacteria bacterium]|nr:DUF1566 domain-containing protein [Acidobacteriota bacterium]
MKRVPFLCLLSLTTPQVTAQAPFETKGEIVIDNGGKLLWTRFGRHMYESSKSSAKEACEKLVLEGISDWRVPTLDELERVAGKGLFRPREGVAYKVDPVYSWSTTRADEGRSVYYINLKTGEIRKAFDDRLPWGADFQLCVASSSALQQEFEVPVPPSPLVDEGLVARDTRTDLVWTKKPSERKFTRNEAVEYCDALSFAGFQDWRLPTISDFDRLVERTNDQASWLKILADQRRTHEKQEEVSKQPQGGIVLEPCVWTALKDPNDRAEGRCWRKTSEGTSSLIDRHLATCVRGGRETTSVTGVQGVRWMGRDAGRNSWFGANEFCKDLSIGKLQDWRLPSRGELVAEFAGSTQMPNGVLRSRSGVELGGNRVQQVWTLERIDVSPTSGASGKYSFQSHLTVTCVHGSSSEQGVDTADSRKGFAKLRPSQLNQLLWDAHESGTYPPGWEVALEDLRQYGTKQRSPQMLDTVAWVLADNGRCPEALKVYDDVLKLVKSTEKGRTSGM